MGNRVLVIHMWEDLIDVVDADTDTGEMTIDDLEFLPNRIVFTDEYMIVLGVGLSAPSCSADGPNFSVFNLSDFQKVYQKDISGQCALSIIHLNGLIYVIFETQIISYDLETGEQVNSLDTPLLGRHANTDGQSIIVQLSTGSVRKIDAALTTLGESASLLAGPQVWFPPIEEMVATDASDGRLFVTNRNDDTLSIAFFTPEISACEGDANGDGVVDPLDSGFVLARFGCTVGVGDADCDAADQNADGAVDPPDVGFILARFGACP